MIVNAAVMGFLPFFRRILLTDALLEALPRRELEAVLAHEVAHVRAHHMAWLVLALLALLAGAALGLFAAGTLLEAAGAPIGESAAAVALLLLLASVLAIFGWVSRRFELQADAFAAAHLARGSVSATISASSQEDEPDRPRITRIDEAAIETVCSALEHVAEASGTDPARSSWRHGSIRWRQLRLRRLRGAPLEGLPIDQAVRRLRVAIASVLLLCGGAMIAIELDGAAPGGDHETTP